MGGLPIPSKEGADLREAIPENRGSGTSPCFQSELASCGRDDALGRVPRSPITSVLLPGMLLSIRRLLSHAASSFRGSKMFAWPPSAPLSTTKLRLRPLPACQNHSSLSKCAVGQCVSTAGAVRAAGSSGLRGRWSCSSICTF